MEIRKVGVFGGSFNPITTAHIMSAIKCAEHMELKTLIFEPVSNNYKKEHLKSAKIRIEILERALEEVRKYTNIELVIGTYEVESFIQPTTYETMSYYKEQLENCEMYYICGTDVLESIPGWVGDSNSLINEFEIVVIDRVSTNKNIEFDIINKNKTLLKRRKHIHVVPPMSDNKISSSLVRLKVELGQSIIGLVPLCVIDLIKKYYKGE